MRIRLLGPFEVQRGGRVATLTAPKLRRVLALLAINANKVVRTDQLIEELWADRPPVSATTTLQTYVYQLRKLHHLTNVGAADGRPALLTSPNGYLLRLPGGALDVDDFTSLVDRGRAELELEDQVLASATLREALDQWRGPALSDVGVGPVLEASVVWLEEMRKSVLEQRIDVDLRLGRHRVLVGELTGVVSKQPTHEGFQGKLMLALYRCGRRSEALRAYQRAREALADELGLEPSSELQRLHQAILTADSALDLPALGTETARTGTPLVPSPSQLPPGLPRFVGRTRELATATAAITRADRAAPPVVVAVGSPGSGKSSFCIQAAHQVRGAYPDGQFYVELTSAFGDPVEPASVLGDFLQAIGIPANRMPGSAAERSRIFRSWTADRRVLVVLDDAVSTDQIAPLLPTGANCGTIVGSRRMLANSMITEVISLEPLPEEEGRRLLTEVLSQDRISSDRQAIDDLVELCDGVPLALSTAVDQLELRPHWPVSRQVCRMRDLEQSGARPMDQQTGMYASVWRTYQLMPAAAQAAFRTAAPLGRRVSGRLVSKMLGTDEWAAESLLEDLVQYRLAEVVTCGEETGFQYRFRQPMSAVARFIASSAELGKHWAEAVRLST